MTAKIEAVRHVEHAEEQCPPPADLLVTGTNQQRAILVIHIQRGEVDHVIVAGNFEAAARLGLGLFVATEILLTRGAAWTLMLHSLTLVLQAGIGLAFLATGQVSLGRALAADPYAQAEQSP